MDNSRGFWGFLRGKRGALIITVAVLGALLLFLGSRDLTSIAEKEDDADIAEMCSLVDGVGRCYALVSYSDDGEPLSAVVICEGGNSPSVRLRLTEMLSSYLGIGANRISVESLKKT